MSIKGHPPIVDKILSLYYICIIKKEGDLMSTISLRVPDDELQILKNYARLHNWSLSDAIRKTMMVAQGLYEGVKVPDHGVVGLITYMRTDSTRI